MKILKLQMGRGVFKKMHVGKHFDLTQQLIQQSISEKQTNKHTLNLRGLGSSSSSVSSTGA